MLNERKIHYHVTTMECEVTRCKHSSKTDLLSNWSSAKYKTYIIIMATMKTGTICNIRGSNDNWRVIGTRFDGLVVRTYFGHSQSSIRPSKMVIMLFAIWEFWEFRKSAKQGNHWYHFCIVFGMTRSLSWTSRTRSEHSTTSLLRRFESNHIVLY